MQRDVQIDAQLVTACGVHVELLGQGWSHVVEELQKYQQAYNARTDNCDYRQEQTFGLISCLVCLRKYTQNLPAAPPTVRTLKSSRVRGYASKRRKTSANFIVNVQ